MPKGSNLLKQAVQGLGRTHLSLSVCAIPAKADGSPGLPEVGQGNLCWSSDTHTHPYAPDALLILLLFLSSLPTWNFCWGHLHTNAQWREVSLISQIHICLIKHAHTHSVTHTTERQEKHSLQGFAPTWHDWGTFWKIQQGKNITTHAAIWDFFHIWNPKYHVQNTISQLWHFNSFSALFILSV